MKILMLLLVYLIWGSTYLAMKIAVHTLPPFLMTGVRLLLAGSLLYLWARFKGAVCPKPKQWFWSGLIGVLLLVTGLGAVAWAEKTVSSGVAALLVSTMPLWLVLMDWVGPLKKRPSSRVLAGLALGLIGVAWLLQTTGQLDLAAGKLDFATVVVLMAAVSWALGSQLTRFADIPKVETLATGMEMLVGGLVLSVVGIFTEGAPNFQLVGLDSLLAWVYLTIGGSLIAFSAYKWLLKNAELSLVSTYAYVNPVIALILGCTLGGENLNGMAWCAVGVVVTGVTLVAVPEAKRPRVVSLPRAKSPEKIKSVA